MQRPRLVPVPVLVPVLVPMPVPVPRLARPGCAILPRSPLRRPWPGLWGGPTDLARHHWQPLPLTEELGESSHTASPSPR
jgi:hypothetical protein